MVCLGTTESCTTWLEKQPHSGLRIQELQPWEPKSSLERESLSVQVSIRREDSGTSVTIEDFRSPAILAHLTQPNEKPSPIADWRQLVDAILIDPCHDGELFVVRQADIPLRHKDLVSGVYNLANAGPLVAVKVVDLLGNEVTWTG